MFLSEYIGDTYTRWRPFNRILINAHTGTGKTHFVLYEYLRWLIKLSIGSKENEAKPQKLLYLVNRVVLKNQLVEEISNKVYPLLRKEFGENMNYIDNYIRVETYQNIEARIKNSLYFLKMECQEYTVVVCDECHYFFNDSNFNTCTELSFDFIKKVFDSKIQIYMSATIDNMKEYIVNEEPFYYMNDKYGEVLSNSLKENMEDRIIFYEMEKDYSHVNLRMFQDLSDIRYSILKNIKNSKEKWLVFTDSIEYGKEFKNNLLNDKMNYSEDGERYLQNEDVIFIDAQFKKDMDAAQDVNQLEKENMVNRRIVIATAVIDNGVSFHDRNLRNVVILSDTEEGFIQMLGRKRKDGEKVNVYISRRSQKHFADRYRYIDDIFRFYAKYENNLKIMWGQWMQSEKKRLRPYHALETSMNIVPYREEQCAVKNEEQVLIQELRQLSKSMPLVKNIYENSGQLEQTAQIKFCPIDPNKDENFVMPDMSGGKRYELETNFQQDKVQGCGKDKEIQYIYQTNLLEDIMTDAKSYMAATKLLYSVNGLLALNRFSRDRCLALREFYWEMKEAMIDDQNAFVKKQVEWLQLGIEQVDEVVQRTTDEFFKSRQEKLATELEKYLNVSLDDKQNATIFKNPEMRGLLRFFCENPHEDDVERARKDRAAVGKVQLKEEVSECRPLSNQPFNNIMKRAQLPYIMKRPTGSTTMILKEDVNNNTAPN